MIRHFRSLVVIKVAVVRKTNLESLPTDILYEDGGLNALWYKQESTITGPQDPLVNFSRLCEMYTEEKAFDSSELN